MLEAKLGEGGAVGLETECRVSTCQGGKLEKLITEGKIMAQ